MTTTMTTKQKILKKNFQKRRLVKGRHDLPVEDYVYEEIMQPNGFTSMILGGLPAEARYWINRNLAGVDELRLYITGFTQPLLPLL